MASVLIVNEISNDCVKPLRALVFYLFSPRGWYWLLFLCSILGAGIGLYGGIGLSCISFRTFLLV